MQKFYKGGLLSLMALGMLLPAHAQTSVSPTGSSIYGFLGYTEKTDRNGWYAIAPDGEMTLLWLDQAFGMTGTYFTTGWLKDNKLCGLFGNTSSIRYMEFDANTGEQGVNREIDIEGENHIRYMLTGAYNSQDGYVYGFAFNPDRSIDYLVKAPAGQPEKTEIIRVMPADFVMCKSVCYNPTDNHFYGIDLYNDIIRFDIYGNFEFIKEIDLPGKDSMASFSSAMVYSPKDKCYFWDAQYSTYYSDFVRIDPETFHCEVVKEYPFLDQITIMCCNDDDSMIGGPSAPILKTYGIEGTSNSGTLTYIMPTTAGDAEGQPSELTWTATEIPGGKTYTGTAAPGAEVSVDYSDLATGEHTFSFYATAGEVKGASVFTNVWIGADVPYVPEDIVLKEVNKDTFSVSWKPVTHGAHNGYINTNAITYAVFLNDVQQLITSDTSVELSFDGESPNRTYVAKVVAIYGSSQSETGVSNQIVAGAGYSLPFEVVPTEEEARLMTYINVDDDKSGWRYYKLEGEDTFSSGRDYDNPGNDWLITPKLVFPSDAYTYTVSFEACVHSSIQNQEFFEIWASQENTVDGMADIRVAPRTAVSLQSWEPFSFTFEIDQAGPYYVGIRSVSDADQRGWYIKNLAITYKEIDGVSETCNLLSAVNGGNGVINISGLAGKTIEVFTTDGRLIASEQNAAETLSIKADAGIYIVKAGEKSWKVVVK